MPVLLTQTEFRPDFSHIGPECGKVEAKMSQVSGALVAAFAHPRDPHREDRPALVPGEAPVHSTAQVGSDPMRFRFRATRS